MTGDALDHERAAALLPWIANGTLEGEELERVELHVRQCVACRAELAEQGRLRALVQRQPVVHLSPDMSFERLRRRLDGEPRRRFAVPARASWAIAATAAIAAIGWVLSPGVDGPEPAREAGAYRTLSTAPAERGLIDVIFADGVRESEMRELLAELGAEIVAGPSRSLGRYTLRLPASSEAGQEVDAVVRRLLGDHRVRFAGPSFAPQASDGGVHENEIRPAPQGGPPDASATSEDTP